MPVRRYHSLEEAAAAQWLAPGDPALVGAVAHVWHLAHWLAPWALPPGVHRFRSIEAMSETRAEWERTLVRTRFRPETHSIQDDRIARSEPAS